MANVVVRKSRRSSIMTQALLQAMQNAVDRGENSGKVGGYILRNPTLREEIKLRPTLTLKKKDTAETAGYEVKA
jgi:hypothetical protein